MQCFFVIRSEQERKLYLKVNQWELKFLSQELLRIYTWTWR